MKIKVNSEIGKLKKVLLHRPGLEVERQYPEIFDYTLFDDTMHLRNAQKDHDYFAEKLKENGVEVLYIEKLIAEVFDSNNTVRNQFLKQFIKESGISDGVIFNAIYEFYNQEKDNLKLVRKLIAGVLKSEVTVKWDESIESYVAKNDDYPFYITPLPNILFQRDAIASIFDGMNIHNMTKPIRKREGIFYEYLLKYHPEWKTTNQHLKRDHKGNMEGGDVIIMNEKTVFVGISERTTAKAAEQLAFQLFAKYPKFETLLAIEIPKQRSSMHIDTMFAQMDYDKFSIDIDMVKNKYPTYEITRDENKLKIRAKEMKIYDILQKYVHPNPKTFIAGNNEIVAAKNEQWNDGVNCLTLEPGVIFVYDRNVYTNNMLKKAGIKLIEIPSGELSRGRGGPHCLSMPIEREEI